MQKRRNFSIRLFSPAACNARSALTVCLYGPGNTKQALCQLHLRCERVDAQSFVANARQTNKRFSREMQIHQPRRPPSKSVNEIRHEDNCVARRCHRVDVSLFRAMGARDCKFTAAVAGLFSRFYLSINSRVAAVTAVPLCGRAPHISRRKPRKSLHELFGSLNSPKLPTSFGDRAPSLPSECRCRVVVCTFFQGTARRGRAPHSFDARQKSASPSSSLSRL